MSSSFFQRFLAKARGAGQIASLRAAAMNGNDSMRLRVAQEAELDQKTLEVLARKGPTQVRLLVASHPNLTPETAQRLARHVQDPLFGDALARRFFERAEAAVLDVPAVDEVVGVVEDLLAKGVELVPADVAGDVEPRSEEVVAWQEAEAVDNVVLSVGSTAELVETNPAYWVSDEVVGTTALHEVQDPVASDLDGLLDDLYESFESHGASSEDTDEAEIDDLVDNKVIDLFGKLPSGPAGQELLAALAVRSGSPKLASLLELFESGWDIDDICVVWRARQTWNESRTEGPREWPLSYSVVARISDGLSGARDEDEILGVLHTIQANWRCGGSAIKQSLNSYVMDIVEEYEEYRRANLFEYIDFYLNRDSIS